VTGIRNALRGCRVGAVRSELKTRAQESSKEARLRRRQQNLKDSGIIDDPNDLYYGPGIDDSI